MLRFDGAVHQRNAGCVGHAVVGGLMGLRAPLVGAVGHDLDRDARYPDVDLLDLADIGKERARLYRRLRDRL